MKIKDGYVLRSVAGSYMVIPVGGGNEHLNKVINLNETGAFIWEKLIQGATLEQLAEAVATEFTVEMTQALNDAERFTESLRANGFLAED